MRVAFLRGVNVGGHRRIAMADLREACTAAGLGEVRTHGASGNVVFGGGPAVEAEAADAVADAVEAAAGFRVPVLVRTGAELLAALHAHPFAPPDAGEKMLHVVFCDRTPMADRVDALDPDRTPGDRWVVIGREIHLCYPHGSGRSKLTLDWLERELDVTGTGRNLPTVRTLAELARPQG